MMGAVQPPNPSLCPCLQPWPCRCQAGPPQLGEAVMDPWPNFPPFQPCWTGGIELDVLEGQLSVTVLMQSPGDNSCSSPNLVTRECTPSMHSSMHPSPHPAPSSWEAPPNPFPRGGAPGRCRPPAPGRCQPFAGTRSFCGATVSVPLRSRDIRAVPAARRRSWCIDDPCGEAREWHQMNPRAHPRRWHGWAVGLLEQESDPQGMGNSSVVIRGLQQNPFYCFLK